MMVGGTISAPAGRATAGPGRSTRWRLPVRGLPAVPLRPDAGHLRAVVPGTERRRDIPDGRVLDGLVPRHRSSPGRWPTSRCRSAARSSSPRWSALLTVVFSVAAALGFPPPLSRFGRAVLSRRRQPGDAEPAGRASASASASRCWAGRPSLFTSALGAQLTWTLPFGLFAMFAVVNRFNRATRKPRTISAPPRGSGCAM